MALVPRIETDKKLKIAKPFAHSVICPSDTEVNVKLASSNVNYTGYLLKRLGSVIIATASGSHKLVMALGDYTESKWQELHTASELTPSGDSLANVGTQYTDRKPVIKETSKLGSMDFSIVTKDDLESGDSGANNTLHSGKKFGAACVMKDGDDYRLVLAAGSNADSAWYELDGTQHKVSAPTASNPVKPKVINGTAAAVPFPVVASADIAKSANIINAGDGVFNGKRVGSMLVVNANSVPKLYTATGEKAVDPWVQLIGVDATAKITPA